MNSEVTDKEGSAVFIPSAPLLVVIGAYGSGKTEICVHLAISLARAGHLVNLADLDIANPYFRSREAQDLLRRAGVNPVFPGGEEQFSDLPLLVPAIRGLMLPGRPDFTIFDVGGDDTGAKVLSSLRDAFDGLSVSVLQVLNGRRPFTDTVEGCLEMTARLEATSRLKVDGYIVNTHLMQYTDEAVIRDGIALVERVSAVNGIPIRLISMMEGVVELDKPTADIKYPVVTLHRRMLPPWLKRSSDAAWPVVRKGGR